MNIRDTLERLMWTVVAAALTNFGSVSFLDIEAWKAAALAAINGAVTFVLVIARKRLSVLPDPGDGLPGLPTDDEGETTLGLLAFVVVVVIVVLWAFGLI